MEKLFELNFALDTAVFYGVNNRNMLCLKNLFPLVRIVARGYQIKVSGSEEEVNRFIETINTTENGEVAKQSYFSINQSAIEEEAKYDGLYAVCTNL